MPDTIVVQLPYTSDELGSQSSVTDSCKHRCRHRIVMTQPPCSVDMVEVYLHRRATWNGCLVNGSVSSVLAVDLLVVGDIHWLAICFQRHIFSEGQLTRVTSLELWVGIHTSWSNVLGGQRLISGQNTEHKHISLAMAPLVSSWKCLGGILGTLYSCYTAYLLNPLLIKPYVLGDHKPCVLPLILALKLRGQGQDMLTFIPLV